MRKLLAITLGVLTAIGGFVDIGDLVENGIVGARYGLSMVWVVVLGVVGICVFAEMSGRVTAVAGRPVFDLVRERLGPRAALANLIGSLLVTLLTVAAEIGGVAMVVELATSASRLFWIIPIGLVLWWVLWRVRFERMETAFGLAGLAIAVFAVAVWALHPDWGALFAQARQVLPSEGQAGPTYFYHAVALFAAAMTPYEVFFFSSGGVEEGWRSADLSTARLNVLLGFPLGGLLSVSIAAAAAVVLQPLGIEVDTLSQLVLPVAVSLGLAGVVVALIGMFAATFGAALETALSTGYTLAQYFGWEWGKHVPPRRAALFHVSLIATVVIAVLLVQTGIDPVGLTEYTLIFSAVALPLTYLPVLIVANDRNYLGDKVNGRLSNALGVFFMVIVLVAAVAAIPLMIATGAGG